MRQALRLNELLPDLYFFRGERVRRFGPACVVAEIGNGVVGPSVVGMALVVGATIVGPGVVARGVVVAPAKQDSGGQVVALPKPFPETRNAILGRLL